MEKRLKNLENTGNTQGILIFGKIQGKDRKFVCLRSKFIAYGGGYIGPLLNTTVIQHAIFAHNTQAIVFNKTGKIQGIWFLKSCVYPV